MTTDAAGISPAELTRIAALLHRETGIRVPGTKAAMVTARLNKRMRALGLDRIADYYDLVASDAGADELQNMVDALTTNVTKFFRESHHFEHLAASFAAHYAERLRNGRPVRIWSAGCSSGQEPFSIALTALEAMPDVTRYDFKILATDIDRNMLSVGARAQYDASDLEQMAPVHRQRFVRTDGRVQCADEVRALVSFRPLNLVGDWPMKSRFDAIFCRNVVIYFDEATQSRLWARFTQHLRPGGALYIGHSERLTGPARANYENAGVTIYRMREPSP